MSDLDKTRLLNRGIDPDSLSDFLAEAILEFLEGEEPDSPEWLDFDNFHYT